MIDDAAQAFGASYRNRQIGTLGDATGTSFFPAKPLGCYGDGGAVFTDDDELAEILRSLRVHGEGRGKYDCVRIGLNGRFDTMQAAVLIEKLKIFPDEIAARARIAARYSAALADVTDRSARRRRVDLGLGAIHHPRRAGSARGLRRRAEGAGHSDRDPLSEAGPRPERLPALSGRRGRAAGHRSGSPPRSSACRCTPISRSRCRTASSRRSAGRWAASPPIKLSAKGRHKAAPRRL